MLAHASRQLRPWLIFNVRRKMTLSCTCCGFRAISEDFYGSYEICPVCGWEDDAVQLANPCSAGGANKDSLADCQKRAATCSTEKTHVFERDSDWRPLSENEIAQFTAVATKQHWTFTGETAPEFAYRRKPKLG